MNFSAGVEEAAQQLGERERTTTGVRGCNNLPCTEYAVAELSATAAIEPGTKPISILISRTADRAISDALRVSSSTRRRLDQRLDVLQRLSG